MSPSSKLCAADVVIVIVVEPLKVNVADEIVVAKGVTSKNDLQNIQLKIYLYQWLRIYYHLGQRMRVVF